MLATLVMLAALHAAPDPIPPTRTEEGMFVYHVADAQGRRDVLALLSPEQAHQRGLPPPAIVGQLKTRLDQGGAVTPDNLVVNEAMVRFLHAFIARTAPTLEAAQGAAQAAQARGDRWLNYYDGRWDRQQAPVKEDLIGVFEVVDGAIRAETYRDNAGAHRILSASGLFRLDPELHARYIEALMAQPVE
jgi:hypothetical protein